MLPPSLFVVLPMKQLAPREGTKTVRRRTLVRRYAKQLAPREGTKTFSFTWSCKIQTGNNSHPARGRKRQQHFQGTIRLIRNNSHPARGRKRAPCRLSLSWLYHRNNSHPARGRKHQCRNREKSTFLKQLAPREGTKTQSFAPHH